MCGPYLCTPFSRSYEKVTWRWPHAPTAHPKTLLIVWTSEAALLQAQWVPPLPSPPRILAGCWCFSVFRLWTTAARTMDRGIIGLEENEAWQCLKILGVIRDFWKRVINDAGWRWVRWKPISLLLTCFEREGGLQAEWGVRPNRLPGLPRNFYLVYFCFVCKVTVRGGSGEL